MVAGGSMADEDRELERMVNPNTAWRRQQAEKAATEAAVPAAWGRVGREESCRWRRIRRTATAVAPGALGIGILGGMVRGWAVPGFAVAAALVCFCWAFARVRGLRYGRG